jgi:hypothetical protein
MRWEQLFGDLEAQFDAFAEAEALSEVAERQRIEFGGVGLVARLVPAVGARIRATTAAGTVSGTLRRVGPDWLLIDESAGRDVVLPLASVSMVEGLAAAAGQPLGAIAGKLTLTSALRGLVRDRSPVAVVIPGGDGGAELTGTLDRVGADFCELALHPAWEVRRANAVRQVVVIPLGAVMFVRAQPLN